MSGAAHPKVGYETQDMFRVSPWITYDPTPDARNESLVRSNIHFYAMNEDVDMDAPQISTLREEETPEPPARTSKFRVKLLVNEGKRSGSLGSSISHKQAQLGSDDDEEDEEEEEDQLIDDDDDGDVKPTPVHIVTPTASTRGSPAKRGRGRGGRRKVGRTEPAFMAATQGHHGELMEVAIAGSSTPPAAPSLTKKRAAPGKGASSQRIIRKKPSKSVKAAALVHRDDVESIVNETYSGTAASSPMPHDEHSPEPDISVPPTISAMTTDDGGLEGVPLPVYPLPSKPFPVQPPPKIGTGFAPVIPLDKGGKPVRRWRQVNREIRGIAGGRWFTRTWAGEKDSEFASAVASRAATQAQTRDAEREAASAAALTAAGITLPPKLAGTSFTVSGKPTKLKANKSDVALSTVTPSRPDSAILELAQLSKKSSHAHGTPGSEAPAVLPPPS